MLTQKQDNRIYVHCDILYNGTCGLVSAYLREDRLHPELRVAV